MTSVPRTANVPDRATVPDTATVLDRLRRHGVLRSWGSVARVAGWSIVWCLVISALIAPFVPAPDRGIAADVPPSDVVYAGPTSRTDFAGFRAPVDTDDVFTIAWVGGSEIKLAGVSVAAAVDRRIGTVAGQPTRTIAYTLVAPRTIDVIRAADNAIADGADAVVVALNPTWTRSGLSLRGWDNLDVSDLGSLWVDIDTWPWAFSLTSPDDIGWRISRSVIGAVEAQVELNDYAVERLDAFDLVLDPAEPTVAEIDPRLPDSDSFWLVQEHGTDIVGDEPARVEALMRGAGLGPGPARDLADELFERLGAAEVPVYAYVSSLAPELLVDPGFDEAAGGVESFWRDLADGLTVSTIAIDTRMWSRDDPRASGVFGDAIHMIDPEPFAEVVTERLCTHLRSVDPALECR